MAYYAQDDAYAQGYDGAQQQQYDDGSGGGDFSNQQWAEAGGGGPMYAQDYDYAPGEAQDYQQGYEYAQQYSQQAPAAQQYARAYSQPAAQQYSQQPYGSYAANAGANPYEPSAAQTPPFGGWREVARAYDESGVAHGGGLQKMPRALWTPAFSQITAVAFDREAELVWAGRCDGRMRSYVTDGLRTYSAVVGHPTAVRSMDCCSHGVYSCSSGSVRLHSRGGVLKAERSATMCLSGDASNDGEDATAKIRRVVSCGDSAFVGVDGGTASSAFVAMLDAATFGSQGISRVHLPSAVSALAANESDRHYSSVACGCCDGAVRLVDARCAGVVATYENVHAGPVISLAVEGAMVVSLGLAHRAFCLDDYEAFVEEQSARHQAHRPQARARRQYPEYEQFIQTIDLRRRARGAPVAVAALAGAASHCALLRPCFVDASAATLVLTDARASSLVCCDARGDGSDAQSCMLSQVPGPILALATARSGELLACGDASGALSLVASRPDARNGVSPRGEVLEMPIVPSARPRLVVSQDASPQTRNYQPNDASHVGASITVLPANHAESLIVPEGGVARDCEAPLMPQNTVDDFVASLEHQLFAAGRLAPLDYDVDAVEAAGVHPGGRPQFVPEPLGANAYTRKRVSAHLTAPEHMRKDGPLVGVSNGKGWKPNSLLYDARAHFACFDADVDPRVASRHPARGGQGSHGVATGKTAVSAHGASPKYARAKIDVSKRGIDGFDFSRYNRTAFAGLENALADSAYTNAVFLLLYFTPEVRHAVLDEQYEPTARAAMHNAPLGAKLALEVSLLFTMLDVAPRLPANRRVCHTANAIDALRAVQDVIALGLLDEALALGPKCRIFHRFLLEQLDAHLCRPNVLAELFGLGSCTSNSYVSASSESFDERESRALVTELVLAAPWNHEKTMSRRLTRREAGAKKDSATPREGDAWLFADALHASLCRETRTRAWREATRRYEPIAQKRTPKAPLPPCLALHCDDDPSKPAPPFETQRLWFPLTFEAQIDARGRLRVSQDYDEGRRAVAGADLEASAVRDKARYELVAVISHVQDDGDRPADAECSRSVLHVRIGSDYFRRADAEQRKPSSYAAAQKGALPSSPAEEFEAKWIFANDFAVTADATADEARCFAGQRAWRSPSVAVYRRAGDADAYTRVVEGLAQAALSEPEARCVPRAVFEAPSQSAAESKRGRGAAARLATKEAAERAKTLPGRGELIAIDSEFVSLETGATVVQSDGARVATSMGRQALARLSVVDALGNVVLDDYVVQTERVVDYATRFSGISPDDLDPRASKRDKLVNRAAALMKLRHLVDRGCVIIGHGLAKDFRVLNIVPPPDQVLDTVHLFSRPGERKISLRFLASRLLGCDIQQDRHDSIEDARAALRLYRKYEELQAEGTLAKTIADLYNFGRSVEWALAGVE